MNEEELKHTRVTIHSTLDDGTEQIQTKSYHEKLASDRIEYQKHINTTHATFLSDIISSMDVITQQKTKEMTITITADERYNPKLITKRWTVSKETYNKR